MSNLNRAIRDRLDLYFETGDPKSEQQQATDVIRAVLDFCEELDEMPWYGGAGYEIRELIAEKLGVSND